MKTGNCQSLSQWVKDHDWICFKAQTGNFLRDRWGLYCASAQSKRSQWITILRLNLNWAQQGSHCCHCQLLHLNVACHSDWNEVAWTSWSWHTKSTQDHIPGSLRQRNPMIQTPSHCSHNLLCHFFFDTVIFHWAKTARRLFCTFVGSEESYRVKWYEKIQKKI